MTFQLKKPTSNEAVLVLRNVIYQGGIDLLEYRVQNISQQNTYACGEKKATRFVHTQKWTGRYVHW